MNGDEGGCNTMKRRISRGCSDVSVPTSVSASRKKNSDLVSRQIQNGMRGTPGRKKKLFSRKNSLIIRGFQGHATKL